jgi:immunity protein, SdpI family
LEARKKLVVVSILVLAAMLAASAWAWIVLPVGAHVPVHWNIEGRIDRYAGKTFGLLIMPGIGVVITALFLALPYIEPRRAHLMQSSKLYATVWLGVLGILAIAQADIVLTATGNYHGSIALPVSAVGVLFIVLGNYLGKTRSTFLMGIRTPWTLSSELSWAKTHRLGGRLFIVLGIAIIVTVFVSPKLLLPVILVGMLGLTLIVTVYSYLVWRGDPNRNAAGTRAAE